MPSFLLFLFFYFPFSWLTYSQSILIKSLRTYNSIDQTAAPIINMQDKNLSSLTIEFDVQSDYSPNLIINFKYCDQQWNPIENIFLLNPGYNTAYNLWLESLPITVNGARYHYIGHFPNKDVTFPFSGKWKYFIYEQAGGNNVLATGRFVVINPQVNLHVSISKDRLEGIAPDNSELGRAIDISTSFELPDSLFPENIMHLEIIENQKFDYPFIIKKEITNNRFYSWDGFSKFNFTIRDILPGNNYRQVNLLDKNKYVPPLTNAHFERIETSDFYKFHHNDFKGGSKLVNYKDDYAQYMNVVFKIRPLENINSSIFLVGSFNNWQVLPSYMLSDDNGLMSITIELKRGVYDYQYVTGIVSSDSVKDINWLTLEGNFWEAKHDYHVFLYYQSQNYGGYPTIIGYSKITSGDL
ncbi:type IX secretion system plug protein domain-containing protein [Melioribacteraceae bacterium 4301-Me]|uniref:type IX secretion system plug protein domain-containing protein n=1 Tax=Pyranulibacter aquaticus TaxID=3163344 RepID=UPI0035993A9D